MVVCFLCQQRRARRICPALRAQICAVCCGTKRLVQIRCPTDCTYLTTAREHPPAAAVRRQQRDVSVMVRSLHDLNERQSELFFLVSRFLAGYQPPELQPLVDDDLAEAVEALVTTIEASLRGVIYEHRPASLPAERLMAGLKPTLAETMQNGGTAAQRDTVVVLRRVVDAVREVRTAEESNPRAFLDLLGRVIKTADASEQARTGSEPPRLILP